MKDNAMQCEERCTVSDLDSFSINFTYCSMN